MTLKKIKKRDDLVDKIADYVNTFDKVNTQVSYKTVLKQIKDLDTSTQEELWNLVESNDKSRDEKRRIQYIIRGYLQYCKKSGDIFEKNLKKVEVNGKYIHTCDIESNTEKSIKKKVTMVPTLTELEQIKKK